MTTTLSLSSRLLILQTAFLCSLAATACLTPATPDPLVGCATCDSATSRLALNTSSNLLICTTIANCSMVDANDNCVQCSPGFILNIIPPANITSCEAVNQTQQGCASVYNGSCTACISSSYFLTTDSSNTTSCQLTSIDFCWKMNASYCTQCSDENIKSTSNCSVTTNLCPSFDYQKWICPYCAFPNVMHESGIFCYDSTLIGETCLVVSASGCVQCVFGYYLNNNQLCQLDSAFQLQFELLPISYYYDSSAEPVRVCLDAGKAWNSTAFSCSAVTTTINYCTTSSSSNSSVCTKCVQSYYLSSNACKPCLSAFSNCLLCNTVNCLQCLPTHFLALQSNAFSIFQVQQGQASSTVTQCLSCSIYSCQYCRSEFDSTGTFSVRCDKCLFGYKLYNHTCISCPSGQYFSLSSRVCLTCNITNSMYCNKNQNKSQQCTGTLYYNSDSKTCVDMTSVLTNQALNYQNSYEILNKSFPFSSTGIINDAKLLMTNCYSNSNGFACLCSSSVNVSYTSLCYQINSSLMTVTINPSNFSLTTTSYSTQYLQQNSALLLLLSELPKYNLVYTPSMASELISNTLFANYLQITTNYIRNNPTQMPASVSTISQQVFAKFYKTFDPYKPTVFSGPGYYFKYTPANLQELDDKTVVSLSNNTTPSVIYVYFNSTIDSTLKRITGAAFVFLDQASSTNLNLQIKKISFLGSNQIYTVYSTTSSGSNLQSLAISNDVDGFVTISSITTSTVSAPKAYFVSSTSSGISADLFTSERIQNLIYRVAFIYILIFLALYLTLIPFCALVDCVDNKSLKRKYKTASEEGSYQGIKHRSELEMEDEIALKINYKDFFPIYNIANTDRPRRLLKLCLFLVNSQHSITFLSLIYFHLPGGQPLVAVLLAIPAYLCTVIMGYLCGLLTLKLPGKLKYLVNLFTLGYWILWVPIMSSFIAYEYAPYVFTFAIIFFFMDMLIDFLETLLMYFTIKQESRQIKLFKALSRWLSYRGYYEFDKMAKAIDELRDNS